MKPYLLVSDIHCHNWSSFSKVSSSGVNSRLEDTLNELKRAVGVLKDFGGDLMVIAGDLFHTRGSLNPEVFNPVSETIKEIIDSGVKIIAIPGNHDLKSNGTTELGNSFQSFSNIEGFRIFTKSGIAAYDEHRILMVPWFDNPFLLYNELIDIADGFTPEERETIDVVIHCGINEVFPDMHQNGLAAENLAKLGFKRIFAGHYHDHKSMCDGKIISIGATGHQTFKDVDSKAGFLIVGDTDFKHYNSGLPEFINLDYETDIEELPFVVDNNFVKIRLKNLTEKEINKVRSELETFGAKGIIVESLKDTKIVGTSTISGISSLNDFVMDFVNRNYSSDEDFEEIKSKTLDILTRK